MCSEHEKCKNHNKQCGRKIEHLFSAERAGFLRNEDDDSYMAQIIVNHKIRPVVVLQNNEYNHRTNFDSVIVLPIQSLKRDGRNPGFLNKLTINNTIPQLHYLGIHTGKESYITLTDIKRLHKTYLLDHFKSPPLQDNVLEDICLKLSELLDVKKIPACNECKMNCDNCDYKKAVAVNE